MLAPPSDLLRAENSRAMRRENTALGMNQCDFRVGNLARAALTAQLPHRLGHRKDRSRVPRMTMRQQPPMGVDRQLAAQLDAPAFDEAPALSLRAESKILKLDNHDRRETVVEFGNVDI